MRVAVTGSQGQVALSLLERGAEQGIEILALARPQLDLADPTTVLPVMSAAKPDIIVNAAAYTAVDLAESEEALAAKINDAGASAVAQAAATLGVPVIQLSTDYVFPGDLDRPYREDDATAPINAYGRTKLAGEDAVRAATPSHVILRTSWVYSPFGKNFVRTMLALGETRPALNVVADQIGQPTAALDIADAILAICHRLTTGPRSESLFGTFHMAGTGATSWADFADLIFAEASRHGRAPVAVTRIASDAYKTAAKRPANSRLDTQKLAEAYGVRLPAWQTSVSETVNRLLAD
ncbi:MAG TPA: dTDP-4-dehydrorhamnose reductase [Methylovirgula sp.]|jgi:dTDP-4-dehydrorhamnose reductase|nr:dTDP-4-dehydrorhamnose reductase [Methylovirgula sp.]